MPQVDLETLVCGGGLGDSRIACETILDGNSDESTDNRDLRMESAPDFPAESYYLSKEDEVDWIDRNAFYERKDSGNRTSNPITSHSTTNSYSNSNSQRFSLSLKFKASIIGLPKPQNSCFVESKLRRNVRPSNARFFPKRSGSSGKAAVRVTEPSSPKVSCIGRVRSKKVRSRSLSARRRSKETTSPVTGPEKTGFWSSFREALRLGCRENRAVEIEEQSAASPPRKSESTGRRRPSSSEAAAEPPGLDGINRFASGRWSDSSAGDAVDLEDVESGTVGPMKYA